MVASVHAHGCTTLMLTTFSSLRSAHFAQRTGIKYTQHRIPMHIHHKSPLARLSCRAELCERIPPGTYLAIPLARQGTAKEGLEQHQLSTINPEDGLEGLHGTNRRLSNPAGIGGDGGRRRLCSIRHHTINPPGCPLGCRLSSCRETWRSASPSPTRH